MRLLLKILAILILGLMAILAIVAIVGIPLLWEELIARFSAPPGTGSSSTQ